MIESQRYQEKIKILYLISTSHLGGVEYNLLALLRNLNHQTFMTYVIAQPGGELIDDFREVSEETICLNLQNIINLRSVLFIVKFIRKKKIDIIHTHCFTADILGCAAAKIAGHVKLVSTIHGFNFTSKEYDNLLARIKKKIYSLLYRIVYYPFDLIIANSLAVRDDLYLRKGFRASLKK